MNLFVIKMLIKNAKAYMYLDKLIEIKILLENCICPCQNHGDEAFSIYIRVYRYIAYKIKHYFISPHM